MIRAFFEGMVEFRCAFSHHYTSRRLARAYDWGREVAHTLTLRRFED